MVIKIVQQAGCGLEDNMLSLIMKREISYPLKFAVLKILHITSVDFFKGKKEKDVNTAGSISMSKLEEVILMTRDQVNSFFPICFHVYTFCIRIERENGVERQEEIYCTCRWRKGKLN